MGRARRVRRRRALPTVALVIALVMATDTAAVAAPRNWTTIDARIVQAWRLARSQHVHAAIAVLDRRTGDYYHSGPDTEMFGTASVVKVFIATRLLAEHRMHGAVERTAYRMITRSDNDAAEELFPLVGGTRVVRWVARRYHIAHLGRRPSRGRHWCWGNTHITARGLVTYYERMQDDPVVAPWLLHAMHHYAVHDADGLDQIFGIPASTRHAAIKQGEGHCSSDTWGSIINSTGIVNGDRFDVAILTDSHICCNRGGFNKEQARLVTRMTRLLFPHGRIDLPRWHNPRGRLDEATAHGSTVRLSGWVVDPDLPRGPTPVRVTEAGHPRWSGSADIVDPALNAQHDLAGRHRFTAAFPARDGDHEYCAVLGNVSMGDADEQRCRTVHVDGGPQGRLEDVSASADGVTVTGWAYDPDAAPHASDVRITVDAGGPSPQTFTVTAADPRPDGTYPVAGDHGFTLAVPAAAGSHRVCAAALDTGPVAHHPSSLGCADVVVASPRAGGENTRRMARPRDQPAARSSANE